jgi:hypothetical protein
MIQRKTPQLPKASVASNPMQQIELLQVAWLELAILTKNLEAQLRESQREAEQTTPENSKANGKSRS